MTTGRRTFAKTLPRGDIFTQNDKTYNAFDRDIAVVLLYFEKSTIIQVLKYVISKKQFKREKIMRDSDTQVL